MYNPTGPQQARTCLPVHRGLLLASPPPEDAHVAERTQARLDQMSVYPSGEMLIAFAQIHRLRSP